MRAVHAVYEDGKVCFPFNYPEYEGPVKVLVIFPDDREEWEAELNDWDIDESVLPF